MWDGLVRLLHWLLVMAVMVSWLSTLGWGLVALHEPSGWIALVVVAVRVLWGFTGSHYARFRQFVCVPAVLSRYLAQLRAGVAPRYVGHNPLGGWMIIALLAAVAGVGFTGWLFTTDMFWGTAWLQALHRALAWLMLALVALHVGGVVFSSRLHHENLVRAMFTGWKPAPQEEERTGRT